MIKKCRTENKKYLNRSLQFLLQTLVILFYWDFEKTIASVYFVISCNPFPSTTKYSKQHPLLAFHSKRLLPFSVLHFIKQYIFNACKSLLLFFKYIHYENKINLSNINIKKYKKIQVKKWPIIDKFIESLNSNIQNAILETEKPFCQTIFLSNNLFL